MLVYIKRVLSLLLAGAILLSISSAQPQANDLTSPTKDEIDAYIEQGMADLNIPGVAFALIENDRITHMRGYGRRNVAGDGVVSQTPFQVASLTKSITAQIILQLAEENRLSIDEPVVEYLPDFRTADPKQSNRITIRHLMNHTSGITTLEGNRDPNSQYRSDDANERAMLRLAKAKLHSEPGKWFQYSNANYAMLAHLIETLERQPFEVVVETRILSKVGMRNSYVQIPTKPVAAEAKGHTLWFGQPRENHFVGGRVMAGEGGLTSSVEDMAAYLIAISDARSDIVPATLVTSWENDTDLGYEFGWQHAVIDGRRIVFNDGANRGFRSVLMYDTSSRRGVVFLMNAAGTFDGSLHYAVAHHALGLPPINNGPSQLFEQTLWGAALLALALSIGFVVSIARLWRRRRTPIQTNLFWKGVTLIVPSALLFGFAFVIWYYVPRQFGVDFPTAGIFPDIGLLFLIQILIAFSWVILRLFLLVQRPNR